MDPRVEAPDSRIGRIMGRLAFIKGLTVLMSHKTRPGAGNAGETAGKRDNSRSVFRGGGIGNYGENGLSPFCACGPSPRPKLCRKKEGNREEKRGEMGEKEGRMAE